MPRILLNVVDLHAEIDNKVVLKGLNLKIHEGEIHTIMGPNGSGKSTLLMTLIQYPREISIQVGSYLRTIYNHYQQILDSKFEILSVFKFQKLLSEKISELKIDRKFIYRNLNEGFSGGEKKKMEILQMALLNPNLAMLDEIDSGLDVDALKVVSNGVNKIKDKKMGILLVTHYQRILKYIDTDFVHVMKDGKIVASGDKKFAKKLEKEGYEGIEILNS